ncbi:hypothetical protein A3860_09870 [Niastella vici]|uniref:Uncharacterized protein n=1 Tax=Niastella vici TaxID=1703345 RepID=A0A1V9FF36_9BACT|nr:hypothetical protein [Niastella vici]OQP56881.1 hypothetical protein A3860_09870 [Niastella vici]
MKQVTLWLLLFSFISACKKEKEYVVNPPKTLLKIDRVVNDSTIVLTWSKFTGNNFKRYRLQRTATYMRNGQFGSFTEEVYSGNDLNDLSFTENKMPYASYFTYTLSVVIYPDGNATDSIKLPRIISYQRPDALTGNPVEILTNKQQKWLYITEDQKVTLVDYSTGRQITSKQFPAKTGYACLGDFNGTNELYVPVHDGTVLILDAATLQLKDKIYVGGLEVGSVAAFNGKLYVSTTDYTEYPIRYIKIYDRATKSLTARVGTGYNTRLMMLESTSVELVDVSLYPSSYYDLKYYQFSADGQLITSQARNWNDNTTVNNGIMRSFPDGSRFITSNYGSIYKKPLTFEGNITTLYTYSDYAFNTDGSIIYAADIYHNAIYAISYPARTITKTYKTVLNPVKIFRDGNTLYSLGKSPNQSNAAGNLMLIEKINL